MNFLSVRDEEMSYVCWIGYLRAKDEKDATDDTRTQLKASCARRAVGQRERASRVVGSSCSTVLMTACA